MIKSYIVAFNFLLLSLTLYSQSNLVPNPGFELYSSCPTNASQITNALPWFQPYLGVSSTDYFNVCSSNSVVQVPNNYFGHQPARTGNGYAGFGAWSETMDIREYLEVELIDSLIQGTGYCVSFYVSLPEQFHYACDGVGAYFSTNAIYYSSPFYGVLNFQLQSKHPTKYILLNKTFEC